ncbi:Asp-tRNA(Asn)/Glu-tRNA(Gln) amidotransferase subunit GatC [Candidatus Micrarchaeota archaeon]|nr:Asp-tRNA(Asn)/Glu-tRNA(Gln) amidotransferase subunit GatC [Candidatus Micrarchaeota archaeon]
MDVKKELEKLAIGQRIPLTAEESESFSRQLEQVLQAFDKLDKNQTTDVKPSYHPVAIPAQLRPDEVEKSAAPTGNAKRLEKGYLRGPRMMKHQ